MRWVYVLTLTVLFISCTEKTIINESTSVKVCGQITLRNEPLSDADVQIGESINWKTITDEQGKFEIAGVTEGTHTFKVSKDLENSQIVGQETRITVANEAIDLGEIRLPVPSTMLDISPEHITETSVLLRWTSSTDQEFREYKLYRKDDPGLDETTGELIYVSTSITDTQFTDTSFEPGLHYYYRIYTLSAFGKLAGSNMADIETVPKNLVKNGNFEDISHGMIPYQWPLMFDTTSGLPGEFVLDSLVVAEGKYSLKGIRHPYPGDALIRQRISAAEFVVDQEYTFSLKMKSGEMSLHAYVSGITPPIISTNDQEWTEYSESFRMPSHITTVTVQLGMNRYSDYQVGWFDDVKIVIKK